MNVQVKHNGVNITSYTISYEREHKICTGIGQLNVTLSLTTPRTFIPWDEIDIYENGSFQVKYYVSSVSKSEPEGTIVLECQDRSKRLIDYFIPDQYTIDYPSYTGYWIKKFLAEAGVSYSFLGDDTGQLLSNYTSLGLQPAYEQIINLLQLSGWYMFFDGNGVAKIGSLQTDLSSASATFTERNILEISVTQDDKMLRNRSVVWGAFDPIRNEYSYADISTHTAWNYDNNDLRTMVVSNSNIPNRSSAYGIANTLLKEFSRITVEKHLVVAGCTNVDLGNVVRVRSGIYSGTGLVTTFGVSMSKNGLITNLILDERCPRLFGFFDFGDFVYVGTYGDGIWRKHIRFDPTWYNFSTGLTNLAITDLHINNEVFSSVASSGEMFYTTSSDGPWYPYSILSLESSLDSTVELTSSGTLPSGMVMTAFSGVMARATIIDRLTNIIKYGIDTWSGLNYGDYFIEYSGMISSGVMSSGLVVESGIMASGVVPSGYRGWIVEWNPFTTESGVYPISYSGNFDIRVIDIENDGLNDYVSVKTNGAVVIEHTAYGYNLGKHDSQFSHSTQDNSTKVSFASLSNFAAPGKSLSGTLSATAAKVSVYDNESINEREVLYFSGGKFNRYSVSVSGGVSGTLLQSPAYSVSGASPLAIVKLNTNSYRGYFEKNPSTGSYIISYVDWDILTNTVSANTTVTSVSIPDDTFHGSSTESIFASNTLLVNGTIYKVLVHFVKNADPSIFDPDFESKANNYIRIYSMTVDAASAVGSSGLVYSYNFHTAEQSLSGKNWSATYLNSPDVYIFQSGTAVDVSMFVSERQDQDGFNAENFCIYSHDGVSFTITSVQDTTSSSDPLFLFSAGGLTASQLTGEHFLVMIGNLTSGHVYVYNGDAVAIRHGITSIPWYMLAANIYPLCGPYDNFYIAKNGTDWYFCNPATFSPDTLFVPPAGYVMTKPYSTTDTLSPRYYWQARNATNQRVILKTTESTALEEVKPDSSYSDGATRGFICGNFFIDFKDTGNTTSALNILYLNNATNVPDRGTSFMVLQRDNDVFHLVQEAYKPIRIDISNSAPVLTAMDLENTFKSNYVYGSEISIISTTHSFAVTPSGVRDYRYTMLEVPSGLTIASGVDGDPAANKLVLYAIGSGINFAYTNDLSSGFMQIYSIPSGLAERIETSNYVGSGQYVFVTTSGDSPMFYQKDPMMDAFVAFSGLPVSRATIIRLDDRV